ncbi:MAG: sterol desaturase family protein [Deltaproteobacteria bacterium]|nr:sterol desaturase family protein [Deltaproteobacteria bacterium]
MFAFAAWGAAQLAWGALQVYELLKNTVVSPSSAGYWVYAIAFFFWAALAFRFNYQGRGLSSFFRFCFPKETYLHRSTSVDVQLFFLNSFLALPARLLEGLGAPVVAVWLLGLEAGAPLTPFPLGPGESLIFWAVWLAAAELGYYISHFLGHHVPFLWEIHKVHHSAEVMTPLTLWRKHPLFDTLTAICVAIVRGCMLAAIVGIIGGSFHAVHLFTFNLYFAIYRIAGQHIRHSHIWWAWGPRISHVFLSPAQHQIHHSYDPKHVDKNFGEVFAIWDWLFGSLYVAREKEDLKFGLGYPDHGITNALTAYLVPLRNIGRMLVASVRQQADRSG